MRPFLKALFSPLSIAVATVQWLVAVFALFGDIRDFTMDPYYAPLLMVWLVRVNIVPIGIGSLICTPFHYVLGDGFIYFSLVSISYIVCITLQWLFLGMIANFLYVEYKREPNEPILSIC